jgi:uncharacterized protein (DUF2252 family)
MATATSAPEQAGHPSVEERARRGRAARAEVPRLSYGEWRAPAGRSDPVAILERQALTRVPELVPIRYGRMLVSPFAFFRGAAAVMAADLATGPRCKPDVQLCGDAHLSNFGGFASPERDLVFDINDFDETAVGPWTWDVQRLAASVEIAGRERDLRGRERRGAVRATVRAYREAMRGFAADTNLAVWYSRLDAAGILAGAGRRAGAALERSAAKARTKDSVRAVAKLTHRVDGRLRIVSDPPLITPVEELVDGSADTLEDAVLGLLRAYGETLSPSRRGLLESYRYVHLAHKVVGVGSVGTRAWIVLLTGRDEADPLMLQVKEAQASVLEPYTQSAGPANNGRRVVEGQLLMQAASDIFLGWLHTTGIDGKPRDFYVRQLWDWKRSAEIERMSAADLLLYGQMCGRTLARAHARSGDRVAIAAYLGGGTAFDDALAAFAAAYADQNELDYAALDAAARTGRVAARHGL